MELNLDAETKKIIEDRVNSGRYANAAQVVMVAMHTLDNAENFGNFAPGELDRLIAEGENSGPPIPYETARARMVAFKEEFIARRK